MKLKQIAAGIFLLMLAFIFTAAMQIQREEEYSAIDMVYYNGEAKTIENELDRGYARENIAQKHQCRILLLEDADYQSRLNDALAGQSMVMDCYKADAVIGKIIWQPQKNRYETLRGTLMRETLFLCAALFIIMCGMLFVLWRSYIRPFQTLEAFAAQVAKGNLDTALPIRKHNYFGAFTESFDLMRQELIRAKESEYQANISKKELIAELSHDIKTPIAAIKAACELLQVMEKKQAALEKVDIIAAKAEMIDALAGNMFHATMEELEMLKVETAEESSLMIPAMFDGFKYYGDIMIENEIPECLLYFDKLRLQQVLDNIVNNSYKYAGTSVSVRFQTMADGITIKIRDFGEGIAPDELALLTQKFYRGSNTKGKSGSGLGLYLADNFMVQMGGAMECYCENGFVVLLFLRKV